MSIALDTIQLQQSAPVELFTLDVTPLGGAAHHFCPQVNPLGNAVVWQGVEYAPFPISATGFEARASGPFPRPKLAASNVHGTLGSLIREYDNLRGAHLVRRRTLAKYLDAVNFAGGNATADPLSEFPTELWVIDHCTGRNRLAIGWELCNPMDFTGVMVPGREVRSNYCKWGYRSSDCGYTGGAVAKRDESATAVLGEDQCSKRLSGCKLRFPNQSLPASFFPGVGQLRQL